MIISRFSRRVIASNLLFIPEEVSDSLTSPYFQTIDNCLHFKTASVIVESLSAYEFEVTAPEGLSDRALKEIRTVVQDNVSIFSFHIEFS